MHSRLLFFLGSLAAVATVQAHHGWSHYDTSKAITITGTIVEATYSYPHASIRIDNHGATWTVVLAPPSRMSMRGIPREGFQIGDTVTTDGFRSHQDGRKMRAETITLGGKTTGLR